MDFFSPILGSALEFAFKQATTEGKLTICVLIIVSVFSWTVIISKISHGSFESVRVALERAASTEALSLEKGMIILSTAVAGGPFIGLLGTVWGVMETFSGIARAQTASLTAMAPGVAGALIATVTGLFVAIPAMFAYNYMVTTIRGITQELDGFASEYATAIEHT